MVKELLNVTVDSVEVQVKEGATILAACKKAGADVPTLCYCKGLNDIGACRICVVEVEGIDRLVAACNTPAQDGMVITTQSPAIRQARETNLKLILSQHRTECTTCVRSGNCALQSLASEFNLLENPFIPNAAEFDWDENFPLIRDASKCVKCMRCIQVCDNIQGIGVWQLKNHGSRTDIGVRDDLSIDATKCVLCGQCITHCPVGALRARDDTSKVFQALADPEITTVVQVAPAVRSAWAESLGLTHEEATPGLMVNALRKIGFDYVFDTDFSADLTIMEEANELLERLKEPEKYEWPMFTSCCPGWIRYMKGHHPDRIPRLSTSKSPQQMFGATVKELFQREKGLEPAKVFCVSVMPCVAKKYECSVEEMWDVDAAGAAPDVDASLTTRELARLVRMNRISVKGLVEDEFDSPLGTATGAAHIFGATGGVMEAALRTGYFAVVGKNPDPDAFSEIRGMDGWKEATFDLAGTPLRIAVSNGLANTERMLQAIESGEVAYDFVEVMACPGGCAGGGGQPIHDGQELAEGRGAVLYKLDAQAELRFSHENPQVTEIYEKIYGAPLSELAEKLLHTDQAEWNFMPRECRVD